MPGCSASASGHGEVAKAKQPVSHGRTFTQLDPPIPLDTRKGKGLAVGLIDYGATHDLIWITFLNENGQCWCLPNRDIRLQTNETMGIKSEFDKG
jgi:hypothetical protein